MVLKRHFDGEGSRFSQIHGTQTYSQPTKFQRVVNHVMKEASLQKVAVQISAMLEPTIRRVVREEVESIVRLLQSSPRHSLIHPFESTSASRGLQLHFSNKLPPTLFTNSSIRDEEHASLQIILVDAASNNMIEHGPLSSMKLELVVLSADFGSDGREDWNESDFNVSMVRQREGKRPLLVGDLFCTLVNGLGFIGDVNFTDNSSWVRSRKFKLGVRAVSSGSRGNGIREAVSEAFMVLDHRGESYQKHGTPSLEDPVWRLRKISKLGASHKKLESLGIKTVKDFLMQYNMDGDGLQRVLGKGISRRAWETMVKHANECHFDNTQYRYSNPAEKIDILFNCVYKVIAVKFDGQDYLPVNSLDSRQRAMVDELKQIAFGNRSMLVPIQSHSQSPSSFIVPSNIQQNIPFYGLNLYAKEAQRQLDFNISESSSYPTTFESIYKPEDDTTAQSYQPVVQALFSPASLSRIERPPEPINGEYSWFQNMPINTIFSPVNPFEEASDPLV